MPSSPIDDIRIRAVRPMLPAAILIEELPASPAATDLVAESRQLISRALDGAESRLVVIVGPCSIHDPRAALDYAERLKSLADRFAPELFIVMRAYFEKPRSTVGWKGMINDPDIDGSSHVNKGLRTARSVLCGISEIGLPTATEFLDLHVPQHIADLVSWGAIGARTSESQVHRELASGLSMPIGFKNATDGNFRSAIEAIEAARTPHWFPGATKDGIAAILQTAGNEDCHIVLRGGTSTGPNYSQSHVEQVKKALADKGLRQRIMIDFSHANSGKNHLRQPVVAQDVASQIEAGEDAIFGVMLESNIVEGRQDFVAGEPSVYGQSITDSCLSLEQTEPLLEMLARATKRRVARH